MVVTTSGLDLLFGSTVGLGSLPLLVIGLGLLSGLVTTWVTGVLAATWVTGVVADLFPCPPAFIMLFYSI